MAAPVEDLAKKYGLESIPESVKRLGQLVSKPEATTEEVAKLIGQDKDLIARLLRIANPRAESEDDYGCTTVEEALQRTGMMISTEILPVIAKLETTVLSLDSVSQSAGSVLDSLGSRLQQSTQELRLCLDGFNNANHTIAPEIERRMVKFEASIGRLPEQLEATIGRLTPMSETIADAAMLSTANIEVIDQLTMGAACCGTLAM